MVLLKPEKDPGVQLSGMTLGWRLGVLQTHLFRVCVCVCVCQVLVWHLTRRGRSSTLAGHTAA